MGELRNCPKCDGVFSYNGLREICTKCYNEEEDLYQVVYKFLRARENRAATIDRITEATGADPELLHKWVRKRRLQPAMFPGLGYPCDSCGTLINTGKLCKSCQDSIKKDLAVVERNEEFSRKTQEQHKATYHISTKRK